MGDSVNFRAPITSSHKRTKNKRMYQRKDKVKRKMKEKTKGRGFEHSGSESEVDIIESFAIVRQELCKLKIQEFPNAERWIDDKIKKENGGNGRYLRLVKHKKQEKSDVKFS